MIFIDEGARAVISFCIRSERPGYMVVPPDWDRGQQKMSGIALAVRAVSP